MFTIIGWYTPSYKEIMYSHLLPSIENLAVPYNIYEMENMNNWRENTNLKQVVIGEALNQINSDIVVLDADCKVYHMPNLFNEIPEEFDMALFELDWSEWYGHTKGKYEICSGTLFFRNRQICKDLIKIWQDISYEHLYRYPDQRYLAKAIEKLPNIKIYKLPYEYCWINSLPNGNLPKVQRPENVIIEHFQASRCMRNNT